MVRSAKERMRAYRERLSQNPAKKEEMLRKERERWKSRKEAGKIKTIKDMTEREQRSQRKRWREAFRRHREGKNRERDMQKFLKNMSPPTSPDPLSEEGTPLQHQKVSGRKRVRRDRAKAYRRLSVLESLLSKQRKATQRYKKQLQRLKKQRNRDDSQESGAKVKGTLTFHKALLEGLTEKYSKANVREKQVLSKVLSGRVLKKYKVATRLRKALGASTRAFQWKTGHTLQYDRKSQRNSVSAQLKDRVVKFLIRDDNSRMTTGKRDTITLQKVKMQKRFLLDSVHRLWMKFGQENGDLKMSLSAFRRLKPFYVVTPSLKDRDTCVCKTHDNVCLVVSKLVAVGALPPECKDTEMLCRAICCEDMTSDCIFRECNTCKGKVIMHNKDIDINAETFWWQWTITEEQVKANSTEESKTVKKTVKQKVSGTIADALRSLNAQLQKLCPHEHTDKTQKAEGRKLKETCPADHGIIHVDFSENWLCKYHSEIQAVHFGGSHSQVTLHTGVLYVGADTICFCTVSDSRRHDPVAIWTYMDPVLSYVQRHYPEVAYLHFQSDGPATQYKNRANMYLTSTVPFKSSFKGITWNFWASSHGKGAPDGVGALLKRTADSLVSRGADITDAESLFHILNEQNLSVKLFFVPHTAIVDTLLPSKIPPVSKISTSHQAFTDTYGQLKTRRLSCFCTLLQMCNCCSPITTVFEEDYQQVFSVPISTRVMAEADDGCLTPLDPNCVIEDIFGKWCVVEYNSVLYPGIIQDCDEDGIQVKTMEPIGKNRFIWPRKEDRIWYTYDNVCTLIPEVTQVTTRRPVFQVAQSIWKKLEDLYE